MPTYPEYRSLVPPLNANLHKGQGGKTTNPRCFSSRLVFFFLSGPFCTLLYLHSLPLSSLSNKLTFNPCLLGRVCILGGSSE